MNMSRRDRQAQLRLDKISEASSPSPKRQPKQQLTNSRVNPLSLATTITPKPSPKKTMIDHRNADLTKLQQQVMDRKRKLDLWQQAATRRSINSGITRDIVGSLAKGIANISDDPATKQTLLRAVRQGKKQMVKWLLKWIRQLFRMVRFVLLSHRTSKP